MEFAPARMQHVWRVHCQAPARCARARVQAQECTAWLAALGRRTSQDHDCGTHLSQ